MSSAQDYAKIVCGVHRITLGVAGRRTRQVHDLAVKRFLPFHGTEHQQTGRRVPGNPAARSGVDRWSSLFVRGDSTGRRPGADLLVVTIVPYPDDAIAGNLRRPLINSSVCKPGDSEGICDGCRTRHQGQETGQGQHQERRQDPRMLTRTMKQVAAVTTGSCQMVRNCCQKILLSRSTAAVCSIAPTDQATANKQPIAKVKAPGFPRWRQPCHPRAPTRMAEIMAGQR